MKLQRRRVIRVSEAPRVVGAVPPNTNFLMDPNSAGFTRLDRPMMGPAPGRDTELRSGSLVTVEIPFVLTANAQAQVIASADVNRKQLMLQNKDAVANLFYAFGTLADGTSKFLTPGQTLLLDWNCPTDRISVFATANISGGLSTVSPAG